MTLLAMRPLTARTTNGLPAAAAPAAVRLTGGCRLRTSPSAAAAAAAASPLACRLAGPLAAAELRSAVGRQQRQVGSRRQAVVAGAQKQQFSSFEDMVSRSEVPLLVDFYATWCGPCQMMSPTLSSVAAKMRGRLQVVKIDTDRYPRVASLHKVQALPTLALFVGGKVVFRFEGVLNEAQLMERIARHLPAPAASASASSSGSGGGGGEAKQ